MIRCTFHLNGGQMSTLSCPGVGFFPAYSGNTGLHRNNPDSVTIPNTGPLPPGKYYIVTRPTGFMSPVKDYVASQLSGSDRNLWFGLFREDDNIDDTTLIEGMTRGSFRLHPAGYEGISNGCITLASKCHFLVLRSALLQTAPMMITASLRAFGTIQVF